MRIVTERRAKGAEDTPAAVALGLFDGLHIGHRQVISAAVHHAAENGLRAAVFTFPPAGKGSLLSTPGQKHRELAALGVATVYEPPFSSFQALGPEAFFSQMLLGEYNAKALFCGENFAFGAARAGTPALLGQLCAAQGLALTVAPLAEYGGAPVSSSRIRAALAAGQMEDVNAMLGRPYAILAPVLHGKRLGGTLGFPTLNQHFAPGLQTPAYGVYATRTRLGDELRPSVTGWGTRPTLGGTQPTCETFIPGFEGDLYGREVEVRFYSKIDDPRRFEGPQQLAEAVREWARAAQNYFV